MSSSPDTSRPEATGALHRTSQLLARHVGTIQGSRVLVVGPPADPFGPLLQRRFHEGRVTLFQFDYAVHEQVKKIYAASGLDPRNLLFGPWYSPHEPHDASILYLPKSRALIEMVLTMTLHSLCAGAWVFLVGENQAGIRSSRAVLERLAGPVRVSEAGRHCALYGARMESDLPAGGRLDDWAETFTADAGDLRLRAVSFPGVFSHGRLDAGTRFFLEHLRVPTDSRILDFGCGSGLIGAAAKKLRPESRVDMVDTNALAIEAARRTMEANGIASASLGPSDIFSDVKGPYTRILSNPPFHTGIETDYRVVEEFFKGAARRLDRDGALQIVANRFLRYPPLIEKTIGRCRILAENESYRIYEGTR